MSKNEGPTPTGSWDARRAFHDATMVVYDDLGELICALRRESRSGTALRYLDWALAGKGVMEPGDPEAIANLKKGVRRLRASVATVADIRGAHPNAARAFQRDKEAGGLWGEIGTTSYHDVMTGVANAMLEIDPNHESIPENLRSVLVARGSGSMRCAILDATATPDRWAELRQALEHEFKLTSMLSPNAVEDVQAGVGVAQAATANAEDAAIAEQPHLDEHVERAFDLLRHHGTDGHRAITMAPTPRRSMPQCAYFSPDGQQKFVWLNERCADIVALLVEATRNPDTKRARTAELLGVVAWECPSGLLASHALALSAMSIASQLISMDPGSRDSYDLDLICNLAAELRQLREILDEPTVAPFDAVGVVHDLPNGQRARSCHAAVRIVMADVLLRIEPIFRACGLISDTKAPGALAVAAAAKGEDFLHAVHEQVHVEYCASLVKQWSGWRPLERALVAEVAGAARAGLVPAHGGGKLNQARFDAAIEKALGLQLRDEHQFLFSRWRSIAQLMHFLVVGGDRMPPLGAHRAETEGLAKLTAEVLATVPNPKADAPGLLELLDVLRELQILGAREQHMRARGSARHGDSDYTTRIRSCLGGLQRVVRDATRDVDHLTLQAGAASAVRRDAAPPAAPANRRPPVKVNPQIDEIAHDLLSTAWDHPDQRNQRCPTQKKLAELVQAQLARDGITMKLNSVLTAIKQRCPRTAKKWNEIQAVLAERKFQRRASGDGR